MSSKVVQGLGFNGYRVQGLGYRVDKVDRVDRAYRVYRVLGFRDEDLKLCCYGGVVALCISLAKLRDLQALDDIRPRCSVKKTLFASDSVNERPQSLCAHTHTYTYVCIYLARRIGSLI